MWFSSFTFLKSFRLLKTVNYRLFDFYFLKSITRTVYKKPRAPQDTPKFSKLFKSF